MCLIENRSKKEKRFLIECGQEKNSLVKYYFYHEKKKKINSPYVIGIDCGTENLKAGIFDLNGRKLADSQYNYKTYFPYPGWAEQKAKDWWDALKFTVKDCIKKAKINPKYIGGISVDDTSSTILPVDKNGEPLRNAILWMDVRATKESVIIEKSNHPILKFVGGKDSPEWMVPKALWLKRNQKEIYKKSDKIIEGADWLTHRLTNTWTASKFTVTCKWNYATPLGGWSLNFFEEIGLGDILEKWPPKVLEVGTYIEGLTDDVAKELGLKSSIPVAEGATDAGTAILGTNVTKPEEMTLIIGSSSVHFVHSEKPIFHPGIWGPYPEPLFKNKWLIEGGQISTGSIISWYLNNFCYKEKQIGKEKGLNPYSIIADEAKDIPLGSEGLVVLDFFQGNRTPYRDPLARGMILGLSLKHTKAHIYRGILEGVAYGTKNILETFKEMRIGVKKIHVCGGGVKNPF